jgi:hypothetical protein
MLAYRFLDDLHGRLPKDFPIKIPRASLVPAYPVH